MCADYSRAPFGPRDAASQDPSTTMADDAKQLWDKVVDALRSRVSAQMIETVIRPVEAVDAAGGVLLLRANDEFTPLLMSSAVVPAIEDLLQHLTGTRWAVRWVAPKPVGPPQPAAARLATAKATRPSAPAPTTPTRPAHARATPSPGSPPRPAAPRSTGTVGAVRCGLAPRYTFDAFVTGPSNQVAHAMALAMANLSGRRVNVLFICGGTGLGKTHLSNAVGHRILEATPGAQVIYLSAESFMNEYIGALQQKKMDEFRGRFRTCDALLIDDVQFLAGREGTQEEFFHTFNALYQRDVPVVLTSDVLPQKLQGMAERLLSRFASGLVAEVYPPELETRIAILRKKAEEHHVLLDDEAAALVASAGANAREIEGLLLKLAIRANLAGRTSVDGPLAREALRSVTRPAVTTVEDVQRAVCEHYRLKLSQLTGKDRHKDVALPRQVAMFLARTLLQTSYPQIGAKFNGKDHTTVMASVRKIEKLRRTDTAVAAALEAVSSKLGFAPPPLDLAAGAEG